MSIRSTAVGLLAATVLTGTLALPASYALAADRVYTSFFSDVAVSGYDPVAYFTKKEPLKGSKAFTTTHAGVTWRFSSAENLDLFKADPDKYSPQYGGYCAWAISQGYTAKGDPQHWALVNGKLYLNYNAEVQEMWDTDRPGFIDKVNSNWPNVLK